MSSRPKVETKPLKIASWNINGINRRLELLSAWLEVAQPDVLALQETKAADEEFPREALAALGYAAATVGQKSWNGVALLARDSSIVQSRHALPGDDSDKQPRYIEAAIKGVLVASIYLPNGNPQPGPKFDYKLRWFERLIEHVQALWNSGLPVILAGDFNVIPTDLDMYETTSYRDNALLQPASRIAFERLLGQGWTDAIRHRHPGERIYTFWDYTKNRWSRDAGLRLDHLLLSEELVPRLRTAAVDRAVRGFDGASDHAPVWIELSAQSSRG